MVDLWYLAFHAGNFLADLGIALFAIKVGYIDEIEKSLRRRLGFLRHLNYIVISGINYHSLEYYNLTYKEISENLSEIEKDTIFDISLNTNEFNSENLWRDLERNRGKINGIIKNINIEIDNNKKSILVKYISIINISILFILGVAIQFAALIAALFKTVSL